MKRAFLLLALFSLTLFAGTLPVSAQNLTTGKCVDEMNLALYREELFERSVVFGQKKASALPHGAVRYDLTIQPWIKTADDEWKTYAPGFENTLWGDTQMDDQGYPPIRRGLLETKKAATSELIPPLLQTMRAFQCRLQAVCDTALRSRSAETPQNFSVSIDGCTDVDVTKINSCSDSDTASGTTLDAPNLQIQVGVCDQAQRDIFSRETNMLTLIVSYDASYRSFLQFAGIVHGFGDALRAPVLDTLAGTVRTLQQFNTLPCFSAQCDE